MVNHIIDLIYEVKKKFERIIDITVDEWTEEYYYDCMSDDVESWYDHDGQELIGELGLDIYNKDTEKFETFDINITLDDCGYVEVGITKRKGTNEMEFPFDIKWFNSQLTYNFARWND